MCFTRVLVHIVAKCHEENLDHYLHSYIKVGCSFHWDVSPVLQEEPGSDSAVV